MSIPSFVYFGESTVFYTQQYFISHRTFLLDAETVLKLQAES